MSDYRIEKELDSDLQLARVKRRQLVVGFDLFTDGPEDEAEVSSLLVSASTWRIDELSASVFSCCVSPTDETPDGVWFPDGKTFGEFTEEFRTVSERELEPFLRALAQVWKLVTKLDLSGLALTPFRPHAVIFSERETTWCVLPITGLKTVPCPTKNGFGAGQTAFWTWLKQLSIPFPETIQELFRFTDSEKSSPVTVLQTLSNTAIWTIDTPTEPFSRLRLIRNGNRVELFFKFVGNRNFSQNPKVAGTLRLFLLRDGVQLPKFPLIPTEQLDSVFEREIPLSTERENLGTNMEKQTLTLSGNRFWRLCGVRVLGAWARVGKVFRVGGPNDVTFFDHYWDEDALVLDLDWPEDAPRVKILASRTGFVTGPEAESRDKTVKIWWHDQFNPLIPKRIGREEFSDWEKIFIRLYTLMDVDGKPEFSLGQDPKSRGEIENPFFQKSGN